MLSGINRMSKIPQAIVVQVTYFDHLRKADRLQNAPSGVLATGYSDHLRTEGAEDGKENFSDWDAGKLQSLSSDG